MADDSTDRVRRHRARKAREEDALARARANVLEPSRYVWDEKAGEYRTVTAAERERMLADATARAERYAVVAAGCVRARRVRPPVLMAEGRAASLKAREA